MASMHEIPAALLTRPFTRAQARELGVTDRVLQGQRFVRVFPRVWRHRDHDLSADDWRQAARWSMPREAHLTGISRIQALGLDHGPTLPVRFVVQGDLHLTPPGIFLHRTKRLPPTDEVGVVPAAAFVAFCGRARLIDAIMVGDWMLHHGHLCTTEVETLCLAQPWRAGAHEAIWVLPHLDGRARSLKESETRALLTFAGLPRPEVNAPVPVEEGIEVIGDLVYREWRTIVEYEGRQHQAERAQYVADIDRYGLYRAADLRYVQATQEKLDHARTLVGEVYRRLVEGGYAGPPPEFGEQWSLLFLSLKVAVGPRSFGARRAVG